MFNNFFNFQVFEDYKLLYILKRLEKSCRCIILRNQILKRLAESCSFWKNLAESGRIWQNFAESYRILQILQNLAKFFLYSSTNFCHYLFILTTLANGIAVTMVLRTVYVRFYFPSVTFQKQIVSVRPLH